MSTVTSTDIASFISDGLLARNEASHALFLREADRIAVASREMAHRFLSGGRLLAFGRHQYATDAQHVTVEFVHPVIVGKRALPALDISPAFAEWMPAIARPNDIVMGFGPPSGDSAVEATLETARRRGAMTLALPGSDATFSLGRSTTDPFIHQELNEVVYHTLWETVHVFFEHRERGRSHDLGDTAFLYPYLGQTHQNTDHVLADVAASIRAKAEDDERLRNAVAAESVTIAGAVTAIRDRLNRGGTLIFFGNGGSATDANDWALDCALPPKPGRALPAISLAFDPATITAVANDVGVETVFLRQLIAHSRSGDVAVAISTSGGSRNIVATLEEARRRGLLTVALLGNDGGEVLRRGLADHAIVVSSDYIPRIQEVQASIYHVMVDALQKLGSTASTTSTRELFGTSRCPYTVELREWLMAAGHEFIEHDVETDAASRARMLSLTGGRRTVPVLVDGDRVIEIGWQGRGCMV